MLVDSVLDIREALQKGRWVSGGRRLIFDVGWPARNQED
jgi:hypothetical protein